MNYQKRLKRLQEVLKEASCDALLIDNLINLYYMTGIELSAGTLLVHTDGALLLVDSRYIENCRKISPFPVKQSDSINMDSLLASPELAFIKKLAFDSQSTSYKDYLALQKMAASASEKKAAELVLVPFDSPVEKLRTIKDAEEITILQEAADLGTKGFNLVCSLLQTGITELEAATELEIFWKRLGSKGVAFEPIIAFGKNSSMPHYRAGRTLLQPGDIVLVDIGVNYHHYHSDMTRIVFFGKPDPQLLAIHGIVKQAQQAALALCRPGITLGDLDSAARNLISSKGYGSSFTHSLGHGVGLEIHEYPGVKSSPPYRNVPLSPGMVITIEPGIYLPDVGGIRIEDTVVITENGHENLTKISPEPLFIGE